MIFRRLGVGWANGAVRGGPHGNCPFYTVPMSIFDPKADINYLRYRGDGVLQS